MIDDLDSLLGDVDSVDGFQNAQREEKRLHELEMRKGDRSVVDPDSLNTEQEFIKRSREAFNKPGIDIFAKGYIEAISSHNEFICQFRELTSDKSLNDTLVNMMKKYRYSFSRNIEAIEKTYSEFLTSYNPDALNKKNRQDFYLFFGKEEYDQNRLDFLLLKEVFLRLREFNSRFRKEWDELLKGIGVINLVSDGKSTYTLCANVINDALFFCEKTDSFLRFVLSILGIASSEYDVLEKDIAGKIIYFESFSYSYHNVFTFFTAKNAEDHKKDEALDLYARKNISKPVAAETPKIEPQAQSFSRSESLYQSNFTLKGTSSWNRIEPYTIKVDAARILKDQADLDSSMYFNDTVPDPVKVNGNVKRAMIRYMRDTSINIKKAYTEFLFKIITMQTVQIAEYFGIPEDRQLLFVYHLGPMTVFRILSDIFQDTSMGVCYKLLTDNKVSRYVPLEFIKDKVLEWFQENINTQDLPFDRVSDFTEFKKIISDKYSREREASLRKVDHAVNQYFEKTGKKLSGEAIMKSKTKELFGTANIAVYNRFIDKTIFK